MIELEKFALNTPILEEKCRRLVNGKVTNSICGAILLLYKTCFIRGLNEFCFVLFHIQKFFVNSARERKRGRKKCRIHENDYWKS